MMKDFNYNYLVDALRAHPENKAILAEISLAIPNLVREIQRLQSLVYLKSSEVKTFGKYLMFRTDDDENIEGIPCIIVQGNDNTFYLLGDGKPSSVLCQNVLTLDDEVRFQKV